MLLSPGTVVAGKLRQLRCMEIIINSIIFVLKCVNISVQIFTDRVFLLPFRIPAVDKYFYDSALVK